LTFLCLTLLGYALFGKGWAYLGVPPLFIGEAVLFCGVVSTLLFGRWRGALAMPAVWPLLLLVAWGLLRTGPDVSRYGAAALRDAVVWGYSAFAFVVVGYLLVAPSRLATLLRRYGQFSRAFLVCTPVLWLVYRFFAASLPRWPWADVPVLLPKGGDVLVHSAGILAFWASGLGGRVALRWQLLLAGCVLLVGAFDRSGLLSFLAVFALCSLLRPRDRSVWRLAALALGGLVLLAVTNVRIKMPGREREISFAQLVANVGSVMGPSRAGDLDDTKQWRLGWWGDIYRYTVEGQYFWGGKGFGVNLADDDGYQVEEDGSLRNPHNGHLTMLARGGVPGFCLWVLVQLGWAWGMLRAYLQSERARDRRWAGLFLFLLAYWLAFMINTTFDVFIEGPMGGVWFWVLYGVGLASLYVYQYVPSAANLEVAVPRECA
jgi:hypothetical protein